MTGTTFQLIEGLGGGHRRRVVALGAEFGEGPVDVGGDDVVEVAVGIGVGVLERRDIVALQTDANPALLHLGHMAQKAK